MRTFRGSEEERDNGVDRIEKILFGFLCVPCCGCVEGCELCGEWEWEWEWRLVLRECHLGLGRKGELG